MLHGEGFSTLSIPTLKDRHGQAVQTGHADITAIRRGLGCYIECKADTRSAPLAFNLDNWREDQRKWAEWVRQGPSNEYWLFLTMGSGRVNARQYPDRSWLVPYEGWLAMEARVRPVQATLAYVARKHLRTEIQQQGLDAITLLSDFEVYWRSGRWCILDTHPFSSMYLALQPPLLWRLETCSINPRLTPTMSPR